ENRILAVDIMLGLEIAGVGSLPMALQCEWQGSIVHNHLLRRISRLFWVSDERFARLVRPSQRRSYAIGRVERWNFSNESSNPACLARLQPGRHHSHSVRDVAGVGP